MNYVTEKQFKKILKSHKDWVGSNGKKGAKANLYWTILIGIDLRGADLREANLSGANLSWINLTETDLRGA
ncbi:MAG: pentapeptide repeat-containing protein, partial [Candidatus Brocadiaceae bacterium]|nr:pentapeptide repeat-containing protein [Candidatus Brocadiaceae bacterium]